MPSNLFELRRDTNRFMTDRRQQIVTTGIEKVHFPMVLSRRCQAIVFNLPNGLINANCFCLADHFHVQQAL